MKAKYSILYCLMCAYIVIMPLIQEGTNFKGIPVSDILLGIVVFTYFVKLIIEKATRERFLYGIRDLFNSTLIFVY